MESPTPLLADVGRWLVAATPALRAARCGSDVARAALAAPIDSATFKAAQEAALAAAAAAGEGRWRLLHGLGAERSWPELKLVLAVRVRALPPGRGAAGSQFVSAKLGQAAFVAPRAANSVAPRCSPGAMRVRARREVR